MALFIGGAFGERAFAEIPSEAPQADPPFKRQLGSEPLPIPPYRLTIDYSQSLNLLLIQQAAATIIPRQWDWPNPALTRITRAEAVPNLLTSTLGVVAAPFIPVDWQALQTTRRAALPQDSPNPILTTTAPVPFLSQDWPNPLPKPPTVNPQDKPNPLLTTMAAVPFLSKDWPNPAIRASAIAQQDYASLLTTTLAVAQAEPFKPAQWPNPIVGRATFGDAVVNLHLSTLAVPFNQTKWFNPPNPIRITPSHEAPNLLITTLTPITVDPFVSRAWHYDRHVVHPQQPAPQHNETLMLLDRSLVPDPNTRTALYAKRTGSPAVYWKGRG